MRLNDVMTSQHDPKQDRIDRYIDENLRRVFSELEQDKMPDELIDLLSVLRAQDKEMQGKG